MSKAMNALVKKLKHKKYTHFYTSEGILFVPRIKAMDDHGFEDTQYLTTSLVEKGGAWSILIQAKIRKISETDAFYSLANTKTIMEEVRAMMEHQYPHIDRHGNIAIDWTVDYDSENLIGEQKSRMAVVEGSVGVTSTADDIYVLLKQLPTMREITLVRQEAEPAILEA